MGRLTALRAITTTKAKPEIQMVSSRQAMEAAQLSSIASCMTGAKTGGSTAPLFLSDQTLICIPLLKSSVMERRQLANEISRDLPSAVFLHCTKLEAHEARQLNDLPTTPAFLKYLFSKRQLAIALNRKLRRPRFRSYNHQS